jgi:hypothetical protein
MLLLQLYYFHSRDFKEIVSKGSIYIARDNDVDASRKRINGIKDTIICVVDK